MSRVARTIATYKLIVKGESVLVGLSGGPDSVALLHLLHRLRRKLGISLGAVYINHRIRPRAAKREARFCEELCGKLSIPFHCEKIDIPALAEQDKTGIEETARRYRYQIFTRLAESEGYDAVAVGHHRDDRVETILFNLFRGSGRQGIAGMDPRRDLFVRPLYDLRRDEIMAYLEKNDLACMTDRSNFSRRYTRNRIRRDLIPLIERTVSETASDNIIRYSEIIADEDRFLEQKSSRLCRKLVSETPGGKIKLDLGRILEYDVWLLRRLVRQVLNRAGLFDTVFAEIERVVELIRADRDSRLSISGGMTAEKTGKGLYVYGRKRKLETREISIPGDYRLTWPKVRISLEYVDGSDVNMIKGIPPHIAYVDADRLSGPLFVTGLKRGMRFHPFGRPGSKKAGDFLTDRKYPRPLRDELPVLCDNRGIVWLTGVEIDDRVMVDTKTRKMVKIEIGRS